MPNKPTRSPRHSAGHLSERQRDSPCLARGLRRTPEGAEVPIIATSASATAEVEASSRAAGANAFVGKPIQESTLLQLIATLLQLEWLHAGPQEPLGDS
jgi:CheY-like chemotaxis protein